MGALRWEQLKGRGPHVLREAGASQGRGLRTETPAPPTEAVLGSGLPPCGPGVGPKAPQWPRDFRNEKFPSDQSMKC